MCKNYITAKEKCSKLLCDNKKKSLSKYIQSTIKSSEIRYQATDLDKKTFQGISTENRHINIKEFCQDFIVDGVSTASALSIAVPPWNYIVSCTIFIRFVSDILDMRKKEIEPLEGCILYVLHCLKYNQNAKIKGKADSKNITLHVQKILESHSFTEEIIDYSLSKLKIIGCVDEISGLWEVNDIVRIK